MFDLSRLKPRRKLPACAAVPAVQARVAPGPRVLWIELTSRCPFDCVFCSRKLLRGAGRHMEFALFQRLIAELRAPEIIRLNYSGESAHYPQLVEACELAAGTGATIELVTALASLPEHRVDALAASGIHRITVSLHALDPARFRAIYRFSDVDAMRWRIERLLDSPACRDGRLQIDLAFVAMQRNLMELDAVAAYAAQLGLRRVAVHPVIRRDPIEERFEAELDGERLRPAFLDELRNAIADAAARHPTLAFEASTPELAPCFDAPSAVPGAFPGAAPAGARIHGCDQDPFDTVHVLADGSVVSCEQRDGIALGRLGEQTLAAIWNGPAYAAFRRAHVEASDAHCRDCPYKLLAAADATVASVFEAGNGGYEALLDGWYRDAGAGLVWGRTDASLRLQGLPRGRLHLRGRLPPGDKQANRLSVFVNGERLAECLNTGAGMLPIDLRWRIALQGPATLRLVVAEAYRPAAHGTGSDTRALGFGLQYAAIEPV